MLSKVGHKPNLETICRAWIGDLDFEKKKKNHDFIVVETTKEKQKLK